MLYDAICMKFKNRDRVSMMKRARTVATPSLSTLLLNETSLCCPGWSWTPSADSVSWDYRQVGACFSGCRYFGKRKTWSAGQISQVYTHLKKIIELLGMMIHIPDPSTWKTETGLLPWVQSAAWLTISKKKNHWVASLIFVYFIEYKCVLIKM